MLQIEIRPGTQQKVQTAPPGLPGIARPQCGLVTPRSLAVIARLRAKASAPACACRPAAALAVRYDSNRRSGDRDGARRTADTPAVSVVAEHVVLPLAGQAGAEHPHAHLHVVAAGGYDVEGDEGSVASEPRARSLVSNHVIRAGHPVNPSQVSESPRDGSLDSFGDRVSLVAAREWVLCVRVRSIQRVQRRRRRAVVRSTEVVPQQRRIDRGVVHCGWTRSWRAGRPVAPGFGDACSPSVA